MIDPATDTVVDRYPVDGCRGNHGMAIDAERHRAFLSCEGNDTLTVFDLDMHQAIVHLPMDHLGVPNGRPGALQETKGCPRRAEDSQPCRWPMHPPSVTAAEQDKGRPASKMFVFEAVTD
jgi:hypothetical protein